MFINDIAKLGLLALMVVFFLIFGAVLFASAPAGAQEAPINQSEQTAEPTEVHTTLGDLTVHSVEADDDENVAYVEVTWNGETPTTVTVTQIPSDDDVDGATISTNRVLPGEQTRLRIDVINTEDSMLIYTDESLENERARKLQLENNWWLFTGPWSATDAQITGFAGLLAGLVVTTLFAYKRTNTRTPEPEQKL